MSVRGLWPYLLVFAAIAGYLSFRMQTSMTAPRRRSGETRWHPRGRALRRLSISKSWEELGHHAKREEAAPEPSAVDRAAQDPAEREREARDADERDQGS
jgi:hypothetical protein